MLKKAALYTLTLSVLTFATIGCQRSSYTPRRHSRRGSARAEDSRLSRTETASLLRELKSYVSRNPTDITQIQRMVYEIEAQAPDTRTAITARQILKNARADYEAAARRKYKGVADRARDLRDEERFENAMRLLRKFASKYADSRAAGEAQALCREISRSSDAKGAYQRFIHNMESFREVNNYEGALEYIKQRRPGGLKGTPYENKLEEYLSGFAASNEAYKGQVSRENALNWEALPPRRKDGTLLWRASAGTWQVASGTMRASNDEADYAHLMMGESSWKDYIIEMKFRTPRGEFDLGVRGIDIGPFRRRYKVIDICSGLKDRNGTVKMTVAVRGDMVTLQSSSLPEPRYIKIAERDGTLKYSYGPICIYLHRGGEVEFTSLRVKHLSKRTEATAER